MAASIPRERADRLRAAVELLAAELGARVERHAAGHLVSGRRARVDLKLSLALRGDEASALEATAQLDRGLDAGIAALAAHRAAAKPGHAFCLRCSSADCEHAAPASSREVFASYGPTGLPRFIDLGQYFLERKDPRIDLVYGPHPGLAADVTSAALLDPELLPEFRGGGVGFRLHGQVVAGFYRTAARSGPPAPVAITFQITSTRIPGTRRRFVLNVVGVGPEGQPLTDLHSRDQPVPWAAAARWAQSVLERIERSPKRRERSGEPLEARIDGILRGLAKRLGQGSRARDRRTGHAEERHEEGLRPTRMAVADLVRAPDASILADTRHGTMVVIGERGRAHVLNAAGKLVTSLRLRPQAIERRRKLGIWRDASALEIRSIRAAVVTEE